MPSEMTRKQKATKLTKFTHSNIYRVLHEFLRTATINGVREASCPVISPDVVMYLCAFRVLSFMRTRTRIEE